MLERDLDGSEEVVLIEAEEDDGNEEEENNDDEDDKVDDGKDDVEEEEEEDEVECRGQGTIKTASPPIFKNEITGSLSTPCIRNCSSNG